MLRDIGEGIGGVLLSTLSIVVVLGFFTGVVREHCADIEASEAIGAVKVDSHWTYILWPPLLFASADPPGRCVRNHPGREALDYLGIWDLGEPEEQVREHVVEQVDGGR